MVMPNEIKVALAKLMKDITLMLRENKAPLYLPEDYDKDSLKYGEVLSAGMLWPWKPYATSYLR